MFQTLTSLAILHYGIEACDYSVLFVFTVLPYFSFFAYFECHRLTHKQHKNIFKIEVIDGQDEILQSVELKPVL